MEMAIIVFTIYIYTIYTYVEKVKIKINPCPCSNSKQTYFTCSAIASLIYHVQQAPLGSILHLQPLIQNDI